MTAPNGAVTAAGSAGPDGSAVALVKRAARALPAPAQSWLRRLRRVVRPTIDNEVIAHAVLRGDGIEIGALDKPLEVPRGTRVRYVDRMPLADLNAHYPERDRPRMVVPDIIDDGETLATIRDGTQDFVIASHVIEHYQDPVRALANMLRVLKIGGVIYLVVPDKRETFDIDRPLTPVAHLIRDFEEGPAWSRAGHFDEWVRLVDKVPAAQVDAETRRLMDIDYSIHFHVWTHETMLETLLQLKSRLPAFETEVAVKGHKESIFVLRRS